VSNGNDQAPPPPAPQVIAIGPQLLLSGKIIPSFAQFAVTGEDNIRIITVGSVAATVHVQGRFLDAAQGVTIPFDYPVPVAGNRTTTTVLDALGTGYLLNLSCYATGSPLIGQVFVIVQILRGLTGATFLVGTLLQGYVTTTQTLGWPGSPIATSIEGGGVIKAITGTTPAAGAEVSETVPTGARWELLSFTGQLTTSAAAGARLPNLKLLQGGIVVVQSAAVASVGPSSGATWVWEQGMPLAAAVAAGVNVSGLNIRLPLLAGSMIVTTTAALAAGDQWGSVFYTVREWLEAS